MKMRLGQAARTRRRAELALTAAAMVMTLGSGTAGAGTFQIQPIRIQLNPAVQTQLLSLKNGGQEELRFQLSTYKWEQRPNGEEVLTPSEQLIMFPPMLTLKPDEERYVRIAAEPPSAGHDEKTYRLVIEQMPQMWGPAQAGSSAIEVKARLEVPVFVQPATIRRDGIVEHPRLEDGRLSFAIATHGNVHLQVQSLRVTGIGSDGAVTFKRELPGRYVLSHSAQNFATELPDDCALTQSVIIEALADQADVASQSLTVRPSQCGAGGLQGSLR